MARVIVTGTLHQLPGSGEVLPGRWARALWFVTMVASAAVLAVWLVHAEGRSTSVHGFGDHRPVGELAVRSR